MSAPTAPPDTRGAHSQSTYSGQDIFDCANVDELRRHILILTTALKQCELGSSGSSQLQGHPKTVVREGLNTLRHMSTLLAVGLANDPPAMHVNAVAGIGVPDGIMSLIATETTSLQHVSNPSENNQTSPPQTSEITRIVVGDDDRAKSLLRNVQTE